MCSAAVAADAVACAPIAEDGQLTGWARIDDDNPLRMCRHWVAAAHIGAPVHQDCASEIVRFYGEMGYAILGTVADGDCGIDVLCQMVGEADTAQSRSKLREELGGNA